MGILTDAAVSAVSVTQSGYKEKSTVGFASGEFLWDADGNHYLIVELGCVLGLDDASGELVRRYKTTTTKGGKIYIKKQQQRVLLTSVPTPNEVDLQNEESLWNS
jgi:hypothetical protein